MGKHLHFETLKHQTEAVKSVMRVFDGVGIYNHDYNANPIIVRDEEIIKSNIKKIEKEGNFSSLPNSYKGDDPFVFDIHMETGTGKTYTYTKTIFELNREYGMNKFIVVVPTLSIKAGTINFLTSEGARQHFKRTYKKELNCLVVESKKKVTGKRPFPPKVSEFIKGTHMEKDTIHVLVINGGMINSPTIQEEVYDTTIFDRYSSCTEGIASTNPVVIIDEPHKFNSASKTWKNLMNFKPQFVIRYGATFKNEYYDVLYSLDSVQAFNDDLVKGIAVSIEESEENKSEVITLNSIEKKTANFTLKDELGNKKKFSLGVGDDFSLIHSEMNGLSIVKMTTKLLLLSNGIELKKSGKLNPYSYSETVQDTMIKEAINKHLEIEEANMTKEARIKTMSLFFIDQINSYRNEENKEEEHIRKYFEEELIRATKSKIKTTKSESYREYLEMTLRDISITHGGYFSKDNTGNDEKIEKEVNEILHDKQTLLDIDNPRRFIFSKWTLREGWDNPNIFVICKLRGSGSETNKLQEVGRGLRIPVNEYMNRVTDEEHYLHYIVDFEEKDFVKKLKSNINEGSLITEELKELSDELLKRICIKYNLDEDDTFTSLMVEGVIDRHSKFKKGGHETLKGKYPEVFNNLKDGKVKIDKEKKKTITLRQEKYQEFKRLWEELNKKVVINYNFKDNNELQELLNDMIVKFWEEGNFDEVGMSLSTYEIEKGANIDFKEKKGSTNVITPISNLSYQEFILELEKISKIPLNMLHNMFIYLHNSAKEEIKAVVSKKGFNLNEYLTRITIRKIEKYYKDYLIKHSLTKFSVSYDEVSNNIHPTKLTDESGSLREKIFATDFGVLKGEEKVSSDYLFDELYYDSDLERQNIIEDIREVVVFSKIPKNSIKIPVVGGGTYSPDFAYVIKYKDGEEKLNLVIETKGKEKTALSDEEKMKIRCAETLFKGNVKIRFKSQLKNQEMVDIIKGIKK